jgi:hypothetical protein
MTVKGPLEEAALFSLPSGGGGSRHRHFLRQWHLQVENRKTENPQRSTVTHADQILAAKISRLEIGWIGGHAHRHQHQRLAS